MAATANSTPVPSRRALLAVAAVPAMLGSCSGIRLAVAAEPHPDSALLAMEPKITALIEASEHRWREFDAADELVTEMTRPVPQKPRNMERLLGSAYREALSLYEGEKATYEARVAQISERVKLADLDAAGRTADDAMPAAYRDLAAMRATTLEGLGVKARLVGPYGPDELLGSIVTDLRAISP